MPPATLHGPPDLRLFLKELNEQPEGVSIERLIALLRSRQIQGPRSCAYATIQMLERVVANIDFSDVIQLLDQVRQVGKLLTSAQRSEFTIGNIVRRVLGLIREVSEGSSEIDDAHDQSFMQSSNRKHGVFAAEETEENDLTLAATVKTDVLDGLAEMLDEIDAADGQIAEYAMDQVHSEEVIMTCGSSLTVQKFLLNAAKRGSSKGRKFSVIQVETYPNEYKSVHDVIMHGAKRNDPRENNDVRLKSLASAGISVICIPDCAIFTVMPRVTKIILPSQTIFSNGSCHSVAGSKLVAKSGKLHKKPVVVLGAIYRLSPLYPFDAADDLETGNPDKTLSYAEGDLIDHLDVTNKTSDQMSPELIDLIVTNIGVHTPSFMYRIAADHYNPEDNEFA